MLLKNSRFNNVKTLNIALESTDKKAIKRFIKFLTKKTKYLKLNLIKKFVSKKFTVKKMSILKSPHAHKKAQEQFELKMFRFKIIIKTSKYFKFLTFIKKIKNSIFSEIRLKLNFYQKKKEKDYTLPKFISKEGNTTFKLLKFLEFYGE